jgi:hypothetical protein
LFIVDGIWNINEPQCISVGSLIAPVTRMLAVNNGLWCATQNTIKILDTSLLSIEVTFLDQVIFLTTTNKMQSLLFNNEFVLVA